MIGANGIVRGKKVTSLARWPPNPSRCWALTWRTIGPMEDYWARSGGLLAEWPLPPRAECFPRWRVPPHVGGAPRRARAPVCKRSPSLLSDWPLRYGSRLRDLVPLRVPCYSIDAKCGRSAPVLVVGNSRTVWQNAPITPLDVPMHSIVDSLVINVR